jgi:hypothetical protein
MIDCVIMVGLVVCWRMVLVVLVGLWWKRRIGWRILLVMWSPLRGVVDFIGSGLLRRLCGILLHFSFRLKKNGAIFGAVVLFAAMVHAVQRFECVRVSAVISCSASLAALHESLVRISQIPFLWKCSKILLPIFWRPAAIRINVVYWFGVASLIFVVVRSWSFVTL